MRERGRKLSAKQLTKLAARVFCFVIGSYSRRTLRRDRRGNDRDLPPRISGSMREEPLIIVPRTELTNRDLLHPEIRRVLRDQRSEIDVARSRDGLPRELLANIDTHLVAPPTDRRAEMNCELVGRVAIPRERLNCLGGYLRHRASPTRMDKRHNPRRMRDEDRYAIGDSNRERSPLLGSDVSIGFTAPQPTFPATGVNEDSIAVNLADRNQSARSLRQIPLHRTPPTHHLFDGIVAGKSEGAGFPGGGERADSPGLEVRDDFFGDFGQLSVGDRQRG